MNPDGLRFVPPSRSLRAMAMLEQQQQAAARAAQEAAAEMEDDAPPLEDDPNETEVD